MQRSAQAHSVVAHDSEMVARTELPLESGAAALGHNFSARHDEYPIREAIGLLHVVGGQDDRRILVQLADYLPCESSNFGVHPCRRLIQNYQVGLAEQTYCERNPSLHSSRKGLDRSAPVFPKLNVLQASFDFCFEVGYFLELAEHP